MQHIAIDLGSKESQVCIRNEVGEIIAEQKLATKKLATLLTKQPQSRVVLETCAEAFFIADGALELGHQVRVVPATLVRALRFHPRVASATVRRGAAAFVLPNPQ